MKYRVYATVTTNEAVDVEAASEEEALSIADDLDEGDFEEDPYSRSFEIDFAQKIED